MVRLQTAGLLAVLACATSCVDINGGAVELRWEIRNRKGAGTFCSDTQVDKVRLTATPYPNGTAADAIPYEWPCTNYQASTPFDIPPGRYALAIKPVCRVETETPSALVPDAIVRDVTNGSVAELNTLLITMVETNNQALICPTK